MVETKVYKVPNLTVDAIVTWSKVEGHLNKHLAEQLRLLSKEDSELFAQNYEKMRE